MSGIELRIKRLFGNKKNLTISALDHVMEYGDQPGIEDAEGAIRKGLGTDALLLPLFMLKRYGRLLGARNAPLPVVRINWSSAFYYPLDYRQGHTCIATRVADAVAAGAEMVICSLFLEDQDQERETRNVELFSQVVREKEALGIPLIGECYVVEHRDLTADQLHGKVKRVTRIMAELGADLIKCFATGERFHEVTANLPVPAFVIGAEKLPDDLAVLNKAQHSIRQGARGIIFGRNIFMARDPVKLVRALDAVMNKGLSPEEALRKFGLTG